jgi:two-component system, chemotaxis family, chemotaxis protein CheY
MDEEPKSGTPRALVVDDVEDVRHFVKRALAIFFHVAEAGNGEQALRFLEMNPSTDVALVDWNMPGMSGLELVRTIRAQRVFSGLKILMMTSENDLPHVKQALAAGADEYIMKPFRPDMLLSKLRLLGLP